MKSAKNANDGTVLVTVAATEHSKLLRTVISRKIRNPYDVEDVKQDALEKLFRSVNEEFTEENLVPRLIQITKCQIAEYWWRHTRGSKQIEWTGDLAQWVEDFMVANGKSYSAEDPEEQVLRLQLHDRIMGATKCLSPRLSAPLLLHFKGYSSQEIAELLETTDVAVRANISRARKAVIQQLKEEGL